MLFELKPGREINLEFIVSMTKHTGHYEICLAGGHKYHIPENKYHEIKRYFDVKDMKGVFVDSGVNKDIPANELPLMQKIARCERPKSDSFLSPLKSHQFIDLRAYHNDMFNPGWSKLNNENIKMFLPPVHDMQFSGRLLSKEEIEKISLDNRSKDIANETVSKIKTKTDKECRLELMEKIKSENADCRKCANNSEGCETCLIYHNGKHHFTNLKITAESMGEYAQELMGKDIDKIVFVTQMKGEALVCTVLDVLKSQKVIKDYSFNDVEDFARFTITKV